MGMTVSISKGRMAIMHDIRKEISANVDEKLIGRNEIFIDKLAEYDHNIIAFTNAHFQPYIDEFNKGKKPSRQIKESYTEHISKENEKLIEKAKENKNNGIKSSVRKPTQLAHEYVLQFGNHECNSTLRMDNETEEEFADRIEANRSGLREAIEQIEKKYAHANILLATFHADEPNGTPHAHVLIQFEGEDYKRGLSHQISISRALELDGLERSQNRGNYAINRWTKDISDNILAPSLQRHLEQEREILGEHRKHEDIVFFREKAKAEAEALKVERELTQDTHDRLDEEIDKKVTIKKDVEKDIIEAQDQLTYTKNAIQKNKNVIRGQIDQYNNNQDILSAQKGKVEALDKKLKNKAASLKQFSQSFARISERVTEHDAPTPSVKSLTVIDQEKTLFQPEVSHKEYLVTFSASSLEDAKELKAEIKDLYTKHYTKEGLKDLMEASRKQAKEQADSMIAEAQDRIRQADNVLQQQQQIIQQAQKQALQTKEKAEQERKSILDQAKQTAHGIVSKAQETLANLTNKISALIARRDNLQNEIDSSIENAHIEAEAIIQEAHKQAGTDKLYDAINERLGIVPMADVAKARQKVIDVAEKLSDVLDDEDRALIDANDAVGVYKRLCSKVDAIRDPRPEKLRSAIKKYVEVSEAPHSPQEVRQEIEKTMKRSISKTHKRSR